jgi:hypothetical protein
MTASKPRLSLEIDASIPDVMMPEQYLDRIVGHASDVPERRLMLAVLLDAVAQLRRPNTPGGAEAEHWVQSDDVEDLFSFRNVCEALGIDPDYLARGLLVRRTDADRGAAAFRPLRTSYRRVAPIAHRRDERVRR